MNLPAALPGETLFSRYIRHMMLLGLTSKQYLQKLFNKSRLSIHPYLTIGITEASQISTESQDELYRQQTLGRLFSFYLPRQSDDIYSALANNNGSAAVRACQLASFKETAPLVLKYCPRCSLEDMRNHGVTYWHRIHQVPDVEGW